MGEIILKDFETLACHGVNEDEKINPQRFLFTVEMSLDIAPAAKTDDLSLTVSYSDVKKTIKKFAEENCFDLIETLADRAAMLLLEKYPALDGVSVAVKKPDAPMSGKFEYVAAISRRQRHTVYLSLGSSMGDRNKNLDFAIAELRGDSNVYDVAESGRIETKPYGGVAQNIFLNSAAKILTCYTPYELLDLINDIEMRGGRVREKRWDDRTLDIDIIFYDDVVMDSPRLTIPHRDMQKRFFVLKPLSELCTDKMHPIYRLRVHEMLDRLK